jgi:hypothetical protein
MNGLGRLAVIAAMIGPGAVAAADPPAVLAAASPSPGR